MELSKNVNDSLAVLREAIIDDIRSRLETVKGCRADVDIILPPRPDNENENPRGEHIVAVYVNSDGDVSVDTNGAHEDILLYSVDEMLRIYHAI